MIIGILENEMWIVWRWIVQKKRERVFCALFSKVLIGKQFGVRELFGELKSEKSEKDTSCLKKIVPYLGT